MPHTSLTLAHSRCAGPPRVTASEAGVQSEGLGPSLDIVIVNWNTGRALRQCLESIAAASAAARVRRVVVVDNASTDDSLREAEGTGVWTEVIRNPANRGFAAACNQGAAGSRAKYLLFLNPDTRLYPDTLAKVIAFMEEPGQRDVGICGIRLVDEEGAPSTVAARFPSVTGFLGEATGLSRVLPALFPPHLLSAAECLDTRQVDQVIGAFFLIRRALFEALDGFDERFFVYFEEVDLSLRARQRGQRSMYFADAQAYHRGGLSSEQVKATRLFYSLRSRMLYAFKHFTAPAAWLTLLVTFGVEWPARSARAMLRGGTERAEVREAYRRLAAFARSPGWRHAPPLQRCP